ncbi:hypothetical protein WJS89_05440 [Sphingomicrobium sp. XHP0235]|uniref:hypothetical protein n=1 Tax=Sphingomicrobium aquimarinum TaxID=3133971 RepID=UPI0031FEAD75
MNAATSAGASAAIAAASVASRQKAILQDLKDKGATGSGKAVAYTPPKKGDEKILANMIASEWVVKTDRGNYHLTNQGLSKLAESASISGGAALLFLLALVMCVASIVALIVSLD